MAEAEPPATNPRTEALQRVLAEAKVTPEDAERSVEPLTFTVGDVNPQLPTFTRHLRAQELVRAGLAIAFFVLLLITVIWSVVLAGTAAWSNAKEALQILLPAETALLGSATGFYFASRRN